MVTTYQTQIQSLTSALRVFPPDHYRWFGERSPKFPGDVVAQVDPEILRRHLVAQVQTRLYQQFYQYGIAVPAVHDVTDAALSEDRDFVLTLSAANHGRGTWQQGWMVVKRSSGDIWARRDGMTVRIPSERRRDDSETTLAVLLPKEYFKQSPGFYLAQGDASLQPQSGDVLVRLYWNVTAAGATTLMDSATTRLNTERVPFYFKVLDKPGAYQRNDAAVLYITKRDLERVSPLLKEIYDDVWPHLARGVPALTKRLAPGLGLAEDPRNGESFGLHRCRLLAEAFVDAAIREIDEPPSLIQVIEHRFSAEGLDLASPHLNPGSRDNYEQFLQVESASSHSVNGRFVQSDPLDPPSFDIGAVECVGSYLDVARAIGDRLLRNAIWHEGRCTWLGPRQTSPNARAFDRHATYGVIGPDLYSGTAGIGLFLARLFVETGDSAYRSTARGALLQAAHTADQLAQQGRIGFYTGWPGVAVACARAGRLIGDLELAERLPRQHVNRFGGDLRTSVLDLLSGAAGAMVAFLALWKLLGGEAYLEKAVHFGDLLNSLAKRRGDAAWWPVQTLSGRQPLTGFAHGAAGIAFALLELFEATSDQRYRHFAEGAFAFERRNFHPAQQNWLDLRYPLERDRFGPGALAASVWCHGSGGIAISRLRAWNILGEKTYLDEAEIALNATRAWLKPGNASSNNLWSLCHGLPGNADILLHAAELRPGQAPALTRTAMDVADVGRAVISSDNESGGLFDTDEPGLLLGLAGTGYFYLRLSNQQIPSVLVPNASAVAARPAS